MIICEFNGGKYTGRHYELNEAIKLLEVESVQQNGLPKFNGYLGPFYNGTYSENTYIRYETQEVYMGMCQEWYL